MTRSYDLPHLDDVVAAAQAALQAAKEPTPLEPGDVEPTPGSIVLVTSTTGTAAQRHYSDGLWHLTTGEIATFDGLFVRRDGRSRDVFLVWRAPQDDSR